MSAFRSACAMTLASMVMGGCAVAPVAPRSVTIASPQNIVPTLVRNPDFEADPIPGRDCPPSWSCTMHNDPASFRFAVAKDSRSRTRFLEVTRVKDEPWALVTQAVPAAGMKGKRLRVSAYVYTEQLEGEAGVMIILQGSAGQNIDHRKVLLKRGPGWQPAVAEIEIPAGTILVEIGLTLEGGGTVGFDDVETRVLAQSGR